MHTSCWELRCRLLSHAAQHVPLSLNRPAGGSAWGPGAQGGDGGDGGDGEGHARPPVCCLCGAQHSTAQRDASPLHPAYPLYACPCPPAPSDRPLSPPALSTGGSAWGPGATGGNGGQGGAGGDAGSFCNFCHPGRPSGPATGGSGGSGGAGASCGCSAVVEGCRRCACMLQLCCIEAGRGHMPAPRGSQAITTCTHSCKLDPHLLCTGRRLCLWPWSGGR